MAHNRKVEFQTKGVRELNTEKSIKNIYWGEVVSIFDETDGGILRVRIKGLDDTTVNDNLPNAYPLLPKFFHVIPQTGEIVRILIPDVRFPNTGRLWIGSIISQPHKIGFDEKVTALSTTNEKLINPDKAPSTYPDAIGVYPKLRDIAINGRNNTDIILSDGDNAQLPSIELRAGKHEFLDKLKLNKLNPASIKLTFEESTGTTPTISTNIVMADRIALITHEGNPKFKAVQYTSKDREKIFQLGHPLGRGDVIVKALELIIKALKEHSHPAQRLEPIDYGAIKDLELLDLTQILNKNIVIN